MGRGAGVEYQALGLCCVESGVSSSSIWMHWIQKEQLNLKYQLGSHKLAASI